MQIITPEFVDTGKGPDGSLTDKQREILGLVDGESLDDPTVAADIFGKEISDEAAAQFTLGRATENKPKPPKRERKKAEPKPEPAKAQGEMVERGGVKYSPLGLAIERPMTFEEWDQLGDQIAIMHTASPWWIGDWYIAGEAAYGEAAAQARAISERASKHGHALTPDTVIDYASLCRKFPSSERSENLSLSHYRIVRALPNASELLKRAEAEELSSRDLKRIVDGKTNEPATPEPIVMAGEGEYDVIMADPPWQYSNSNVNGAAAKHYRTMTDDQICAFLEDNAIKTGPSAALFLWVTNPFLEVGLRVMKAWGFEYKTNIAWVKETNKMGPGFYVRGAHELLYIGIKGKCMQPAAKNIKSVLVAPPMEHSKKPEEAYDIIEAMYPDAKKIECFARHVRHKWDRIGLEAPPAGTGDAAQSAAGNAE